LRNPRRRNNDWQEHPEHRPPGLAVELDDAAVVANDLGDECKTKASSVPLGRDEGIKEVRLEVIGDAAAIIGNRNHQRQMPARLAARHREPQTVPVGRRQGDLAARVRGGLGGVFDKVEENLE